MDRSGSAPQDIPRINTRTDSGFTGSPGGIWEARSPASSESGYSNPSSPNFDFAGEDLAIFQVYVIFLQLTISISQNFKRKDQITAVTPTALPRINNFRKPLTSTSF